MSARPRVPPALRLRGREFVWGERTFVMGIVNATPDSFSGDGVGADAEAAAALARAFEAEGADLIDVGAESTRPGAAPVDPAEELARAIPAVAAVRAATALPVSIDTRRAQVAAAALDAGADLVNDIDGLRGDPDMAAAAARGAALVAMHNQRGRAPGDPVASVRAGWRESLRLAREAGIDAGRVILDPGFGFGWTPEESLALVRRLGELTAEGPPVLIGPSRKSALGLVLDGAPASERLEGTAAAVAIAIANGASVVRVHDVAAMRRVARAADAIARGNWRAP